MKRLCAVTVSDLPDLDWRPLAHGVKGYAMISEPDGFDGIIAEVLKKTGGRKGVCFVSRLVPGQVIETHTDHHDNGCTMRIHVPLVTNPKAFIVEDGKKKYMKKGYAYAIDPTKPHGAVNEGKTDRIHLMFNILKD